MMHWGEGEGSSCQPNGVFPPVHFWPGSTLPHLAFLEPKAAKK